MLAVESNLEALPGTVVVPNSSLVLSVNINMQKMFAFVEFFTVAHANLALELNGIYFNGLNLKIGRPKSGAAINPSLRPLGGMDILSTLTPVLNPAAVAAARNNLGLPGISTLAEPPPSVVPSTTVGTNVNTAVIANNVTNHPVENTAEDDQPLEEDERFSLRGV